MHSTLVGPIMATRLKTKESPSCAWWTTQAAKPKSGSPFPLPDGPHQRVGKLCPARTRRVPGALPYSPCGACHVAGESWVRGYSPPFPFRAPSLYVAVVSVTLMAFATDRNRLQTALATSSNRLSNRLLGRL